MNQASEIYSGYLNITKKQILGGSKLVKKWCVLKKYGASNKLEYHESKVHLSNKPNSTDLDQITNIEKIDHGFKILFEKRDKLIFKCEEECELGWIQALNSLLPTSKDTMSRASFCSSLGDDVIVDEVILYESFSDAPTFYVEVEPNEDSRKCHLSKGIKYKLVANKYNVAIRDLQDNILWQCPYMYVRRYVRANGIFQIEAGRRCPTGVGTFLLLTEEGDKIFECINDRTQTKRIQDNKDYLHPPPKQAQPPTKTQAPPPTRTQAPPPVKSPTPTPTKTQAPPPLKTPTTPPTKTQAPPPVKTPTPPPTRTQAPPPMKTPTQPPTRTQAPPPVKIPTEHKDTPENFPKPAVRSTSSDTSQKHLNASGAVASSQPHDRTFKQTLDEKLSNPLSSPEPEKLLLKGPLTNPHIGEAHAKKLSPPLSKKKKEIEKEKKKEEKERKKEEKERKKEEKKEKKEKKKNQKDKPACPPPTLSNDEPLGQYEEVDRMTNQELAEGGNLYESMPNEAVPVVRNALSSGVYSEADTNKKKPVTSLKPGEAASRGQTESKVISPSKNTYSEPQKVSAAWRDQSEKSEDHFEDYANIKLAAKEKKNMDIFQGNPQPDDEEDETYDSINAPRREEQMEPENIYGYASCKALEDVDNHTDNGYEVTHINVEVISLSGDKTKQSDKILTLQNPYTPSESSDFDTYDQIK